MGKYATKKKCPNYSICGWSTFYASNYHDHVNKCGKSESERKLLQCAYEDCLDEFENGSARYQHVLDVHTNDEERDSILTCDFCQKKYEVYSSLYAHVNRDHKNAEKYKCGVCPKILSGNRELHNHRYCRHGIIPPAEWILTCKTCKEEFYLDWMYHEHRDMCDGLDIMCDICSRKCDSRGQLRNHRRSHLQDNVVSSGEFMCLPCGLENLTKEEVKEHFTSGCHDQGAEKLVIRVNKIIGEKVKPVPNQEHQFTSNGYTVKYMVNEEPRTANKKPGQATTAEELISQFIVSMKYYKIFRGEEEICNFSSKPGVNIHTQFTQYIIFDCKTIEHYSGKELDVTDRQLNRLNVIVKGGSIEGVHSHFGGDNLKKLNDMFIFLVDDSELDDKRKLEFDVPPNEIEDWKWAFYHNNEKRYIGGGLCRLRKAGGLNMRGVIEKDLSRWKRNQSKMTKYVTSSASSSSPTAPPRKKGKFDSDGSISSVVSSSFAIYPDLQFEHDEQVNEVQAETTKEEFLLIQQHNSRLEHDQKDVSYIYGENLFNWHDECLFDVKEL